MPLGPPRDDHCDPEPMMSAAVSMAANEDVTIVRRFDELNILSLLLLQDDINKLSNELKQLCPIRSQNTEAPNDWYMSHVRGEPNREEQQGDIEGRDTQRKHTWLKIKGALK